MSDKGDPWGTPSDESPEWAERQPTEGQQPGQGAQQPGWGPAEKPVGAGPPYPPPPGYGQQPPPGYGQQPPPGYGQQPPAWGAAPPYYGGPQTSGKATAVLVLGIVSLVLLFSCIGFIPAIIALVMAKGAQREVAESDGRLTGEGQIKAGKIMSWITIGLTVLAGLVAVIAAVALVGGATSESTAGRALDRAPASSIAFDLRPGAG